MSNSKDTLKSQLKPLDFRPLVKADFKMYALARAHPRQQWGCIIHVTQSLLETPEISRSKKKRLHRHVSSAGINRSVLTIHVF